MDPNLLPPELRGQEKKELEKEKRQVESAGEILTAPERRGKAAIDDETFRLSLPAERPPFPVDIEEQKSRHEKLREGRFGEKKMPLPPPSNSNWHVPKEHAVGDSWLDIMKHPFGRKAVKEFYLGDNAVKAGGFIEPSGPEPAPMAGGRIEAQEPVLPPAQPETQEKTQAEHQAEIHHHISRYFLYIAMPALFIAVIYGLYLLLISLPPPFNLNF